MIDTPIQTRRALLTWQTPLGSDGSRIRRAVGEIVAEGKGARFRYLKGTPAFQTALDEGFAGYPGLPLDIDQASSDALAIFLRRLPSRERSDYAEFLQMFGLSPKAYWTGLSVLSYTGARLASDSFSFAETFDGFDRPFRFIFDVAGYRRREPDHEGLRVAERVNFVPEPTNGFDPNAVQIQRQSGAQLGYVSSVQSARVAAWLRDGAIAAEIFRINGRPVYPRLFVLADVIPQRAVQAA